MRKLGDPIVVVNEGPRKNWTPGNGTDHEPVFFGKIGRETAYFGFDLSQSRVKLNPDTFQMVIYEPMGRLRFGLDVGNAQVRRDRTDHSTLSLGFPMKRRDKGFDTLPVATPLALPPSRSRLDDWDDLSWSHMARNSADYIKFDRSLRTRHGADLWGASKSSASLARSFWQKPVAAVLPFKRILP